MNNLAQELLFTRSIEHTLEPERPFLENIGRKVLKAAVAYRYAVETEGEDNIPGIGPFIIAARHQRLADPYIILAHSTRKLHALVYFYGRKFRPKSWLTQRLGHVQVDTSGARADTKALEIATSYVRQGEGLLIFPEGERRFQAIGRMHRGVAKLAIESLAPVVPTTIAYDDYANRTTIKYGGRLYPADLAEELGPAPITVQQRRLTSLIGQKILELGS